MPLEFCKFRNSANEAAAFICKAMLAEEFEKGDIIRTESVAEWMSLPYEVVREAFTFLSSDGLVEIRNPDEALVIGITPKYLISHYEKRIELEGLGIVQICKNKGNNSKIIKACLMAKEAFEDGDFEMCNDMNRAFHIAICEEANNKDLLVSLLHLWNGACFGREGDEKDFMYHSQIEHEQIVRALKNYDENEARIAMELHIHRVKQNALNDFYKRMDIKRKKAI